MAKKKESRLQLRIRQALEREFQGSFFYKVHGGPFTPSGIPDLAGVVYGRSVFVEAKRPEGEVSRVQHRRIRQLGDAGAIVCVATSVDEAIEQVWRGLRRQLPRVG